VARHATAHVTEVSHDVELDELVCEARRDRLADLLSFVQRACERAALDADVAFDVRLATEEVVTNVIEHGYAGADVPGPIAVRFRREPRQVVITIDDLAPPFDPATIRPPDPTAPLEARRIGGLGWHFVRRVMDEVRHEHRLPRGNRVTLVKRLPATN
jgi:serine/threonine-protein kinase RsbW